MSDVDELINNLEKLIAKKKAIKHNTMQQLLTPPNKGGKRLAGVEGAGKEKKLGEIVIYKNGKAHENSVVENGDYVIVNLKFISTDESQSILTIYFVQLQERNSYGIKRCTKWKSNRKMFFSRQK